MDKKKLVKARIKLMSAVVELPLSEQQLQNILNLADEAFGFAEDEQDVYSNKKEWEILSFLFIEHNEIIECGRYNTHNFYDRQPHLYSIYSVKRLSDGEIFNVGYDTGNGREQGVIESFKLIGGVNMQVVVANKKGHKYMVDLKSLDKATQPLFTTEDGVPVHYGDKVFWTNITERSYWSVSEILILKGQTDFDHKSGKYFSKEAAANEYIAWNKPHLSAKEIVDRFFTTYPDAIIAYSKSKLKL